MVGRIIRQQVTPALKRVKPKQQYLEPVEYLINGNYANMRASVDKSNEPLKLNSYEMYGFIAPYDKGTDDRLGLSMIGGHPYEGGYRQNEDEIYVKDLMTGKETVYPRNAFDKDNWLTLQDIIKKYTSNYYEGMKQINDWENSIIKLNGNGAIKGRELQNRAPEGLDALYTQDEYSRWASLKDQGVYK